MTPSSPTPDIMEKLREMLTLNSLDFLYSLAILVFGWLCVSYLHRYMKKKVQKNDQIDVTFGLVIADVVRYVLLGFVLIAVLNKLGVQTTSIIAVLGAAGLAIGLALQGTLSNIAAGIVLLITRPFKVGESIKTPDIEYGKVSDITLFATEVKTFDGKTVFIPNSKLFSGAITNFTRNRKRRVEFSFSISYEDDPKRVIDLVLAALKKDPLTVSPEPECYVWDFLDSGIEIQVRVWAAAANFLAMRVKLPLIAQEMVQKAGASFPYPQRVVMLKNGPKDTKVPA